LGYFTSSVATLGRALYLFRPLLSHDVVFRRGIRTWIELRNEIAVPPEEARGENPRPQILPEPLVNRRVAQIRFFQDLPTGSGILRKQLLEFHHEPGIFVQDFQNLLRGGRHAVKIVRDDVRSGPRGNALLLWRAGCGGERSSKAAR
jgi:hypothetical protein